MSPRKNPNAVLYRFMEWTLKRARGRVRGGGGGGGGGREEEAGQNEKPGTPRRSSGSVNELQGPAQTRPQSSASLAGAGAAAASLRAFHHSVMIGRRDTKMMEDDRGLEVLLDDGNAAQGSSLPE